MPCVLPAGILGDMDATRSDATTQSSLTAEAGLVAARHCPRCGGANLVPDATDVRAYSCVDCGTRSRMTRRGTLLPVGWVCGTCGHDNERGNRFCTACGDALTKQCPNCGAPMLRTDEFCTQCGKSRGQLVAEWYRVGRGALDAGRPWEAVAPLQRLADVDPEYGDIPNLLARALREVARTPPPAAPPAPQLPPALATLAPKPLASTPADMMRAAIAHAAANPRVRRRLFLSAGAVGVGAGLLCVLVGWLMGSFAFGVLLFVFLAALLAVNLWATFRQR